MPPGRNPESEARKKHIVSILQQKIGPLERKYSINRDWYCAHDGKIEIFITDSKPHPNRRRWWDMAHKDVKKLAAHPAAFVIFIMGHETSFLVIPAKDLLKNLPNYSPGHPTNDGRYHLNLSKRTFEQIPGWDLFPYKEKIDLISN